MRLRLPFSSAFDVRQVHHLSEKQLNKQIESDHAWVVERLRDIDASDRPNLKFEIDVLLEASNFRANWIAIATHLRHVPDLATSRGLELGSSVGTKLLIMRRLGATNIVGCDAASHLIDDGQRWIEQSGVTGVSLVASDEQSVPFDDQSFDWVTLQMVYCQLNDEAVEPLVAEMYRVLPPGGVALIHDGANPLHAPTAEAMRAYYRDVELGDGGVEAPSGALHEMRRAFVSASFPDLDASIAEELARNTVYMRSEQVEAAVRDFIDNGTLPSSPFDAEARALRAPVALDGQAVRRPTDPFEMRDRFERAGFTVEFQKSYLGGSIRDPDEHYQNDPSIFIIAHKA